MNDSCYTYRKDSFVGMAAYIAVLVPSIWLLSHVHLGIWRIPVAIAPALPCLLIVRAVQRFLSRCDELQVRIHLQSFAFAFACTAVLTLTYGFLQNAGFPNVNWAWVWPIMGSLFMVGQQIAKRKYQ